MRTYIYILSIITFFSFTTKIESTTDVDWQTDYKKVLKKAKKSNKNVLVYFTGSDWCPPCKMLKKDLFEKEAFKELSNDYVLLYVDVPRNKDLITPKLHEQNKSLMSKYNKKGVFPLMVVLSDNGVLLDDYSGYSMNGKVQYHLDFLKKNK